ncbi:MAG: hypothetical protein MR210_08740 [Erysipelotrichaceae bacterium]|nr:hypothetical protein [Erysipelotrichaceae bacterium]MDY5252805.1 hypothetical protein [Erysipelotrichaceae bacterium]
MQIKVRQYDLLSDLLVEKVVDGTIFSENLLAYSMDENNVKVSINDDEILLVNKSSQGITTIHLIDGRGECRVVSPLGELVFEAIVDAFACQNQEISLKYRLVANGEVVSHYQYEWKGI